MEMRFHVGRKTACVVVQGKEGQSYVDLDDPLNRLIDRRHAGVAVQPRLGLLSIRSSGNDSRHLSGAPSFRAG